MQMPTSDFSNSLTSMNSVDMPQLTETNLAKLLSLMNEIDKKTDKVDTCSNASWVHLSSQTSQSSNIHKMCTQSKGKDSNWPVVWKKPPNTIVDPQRWVLVEKERGTSAHISSVKPMSSTRGQMANVKNGVTDQLGVKEGKDSKKFRPEIPIRGSPPHTIYPRSSGSGGTHMNRDGVSRPQAGVLDVNANIDMGGALLTADSTSTVLMGVGSQFSGDRNFIGMRAAGSVSA